MSFKTFVKAVPFSGFNVPLDILPSFHKEAGWPKGFKIPNNKEAWAGIIMPWDVADVDGQNPLLSVGGYTHVEEGTNPVDGNTPAKANSSHLLGDQAWSNVLAGTDPTQWNNGQINSFASNKSRILLDYEHMGDGPSSTGAMQEKMAFFSLEASNRGTKLGAWAQGIVNPTPMYEINESTGAFLPSAPNTTSCNQWVAMYSSTGTGPYIKATARANSLVTQGGLKVSNPFFYRTAYLDASQLYYVIAAIEIGKVIDPTTASIPAIWLQVEPVDNYPIQYCDIIKPNRTKFRKYIKPQTPPECVLGDALWCLLVADGYYDFDTGAIATNDTAYCASEFDNVPLPTRQGRTGTNRTSWYPNKYYGYANYRYLANWMVSQTPYKETIQGAVNPAWVMPEYNVTSGANVWRTGNNVYPSWAQKNKEPMIRYKINDAGTQVVFIAQNPYNEGTETVNIRNVANTWDTTITLEAGWPTLGYINI